ncbi:MAG: cell division protein ZapA [Sphingomonadales bacterium]|jgi:cell division protein ZapA|nr:cell division protein ZapA [Sphingomonadales bacterium]
MASVEVEIAARKYSVACRDGEEEHLRSVAAIVDRKARDAAGALGTLSEARQLLFASLLLADELKEHRSGQPPAQPAELDPAVLDSLERLAARVESLAEQLERSAPAS